MQTQDGDPVVIIGAGLAGLCCARALEAAGRPAVVFEAADDVGGRVRTDKVDGFLLDRGFQVFLDSYPEAGRVLDLEALQLCPFEPGALTRRSDVGGWLPLSDPFRRPGRALATALSPAATFRDKWLIARLRRDVIRGDAEQLLREDEKRSTLDFLRAYGFSERIIETFFRPFFGGVFLDRSLSTSARLFRWLFRLFAKGNACLPAAGMESIPRQLAVRLKNAELRMSTRVASVDAKAVTLEGGETIDAEAVVVATDGETAAALLGERLAMEPRPMRTTTTFYFAADAPATHDNILLLSGEDSRACGPVNTVAQLSVAAPSYAPEGQTLLSASVVDADEPDEAKLLDAVRAGLSHMLGGDYGTGLRHLRTYTIERALPSQPPPVLADPHKPAKLAEGLFVCGDHRDTASINGAMLSGRRAAEALIASHPAL